MSEHDESEVTQSDEDVEAHRRHVRRDAVEAPAEVEPDDDDVELHLRRQPPTA